MPRILAILAAITFVGGVAATEAWGGSPHFISCSVTEAGNTLTVNGKETGLGDEEQIHVVVSATASSINPVSNHPKAENKESVSAGEDVPVRNVKALFSIEVTATFQPDCSPPMTSCSPTSPSSMRRTTSLARSVIAS